MERLTAKRVNGIKSGYWSPAKKDELVQRLGKYEDTGMESEELQKSLRWIPVEEQLPKEGARIIICTERDFRCEAIRTQTGKYFRYGIELSEILGQKIVAWMPLPDPYRP